MSVSICIIVYDVNLKSDRVGSYTAYKLAYKFLYQVNFTYGHHFYCKCCTHLNL